jgi:hypothetical protein
VITSSSVEMVSALQNLQCSVAAVELCGRPVLPGSCDAGQMFEGTPEVMLSSIKKAMLLPKNTLMFPGTSDTHLVEKKTVKPLKNLNLIWSYVHEQAKECNRRAREYAQLFPKS